MFRQSQCEGTENTLGIKKGEESVKLDFQTSDEVFSGPQNLIRAVRWNAYQSTDTDQVNARKLIGTKIDVYDLQERQKEILGNVLSPLPEVWSEYPERKLELAKQQIELKTMVHQLSAKRSVPEHFDRSESDYMIWEQQVRAFRTTYGLTDDLMGLLIGSRLRVSALACLRSKAEHISLTSGPAKQRDEEDKDGETRERRDRRKNRAAMFFTAAIATIEV
ncbi:hypothetical protein KM043_018801 [Ampulex compressa]|nr:hypothetical protein KM043_018801 [Ampulex compressa]